MERISVRDRLPETECECIVEIKDSHEKLVCVAGFDGKRFVTTEDPLFEYMPSDDCFVTDITTAVTHWYQLPDAQG